MAVPAPLAADNAAVIAHLNQLQAIITRLAGNSAQCKTWCLAIVSALVGFAGASKIEGILTTAIMPVVIFCLVDAAYLGSEKAYRELYNSLAGHVRAGTYTINDSFNLTAPADIGHYFKALFSWSVLPVYSCLVAVYWLAKVSGLLK